MKNWKEIIIILALAYLGVELVVKKRAQETRRQNPEASSQPGDVYYLPLSSLKIPANISAYPVSQIGRIRKDNGTLIYGS